MAIITKFVSSYDALSECCAQAMIDAIRQNPAARIVLATGYSPQLAYRMFVRMVQELRVDTSQVIWIKLDEWLGLGMENAATCETFLRKEILAPLRVAPERYITFQSLCESPVQECLRIEQELDQLGEVDLCILGIGKNGHLGLNEPAGELFLGAHVAELTPETLRHEMLASAGGAVTHGLTLGIGNIFSARAIMLLAVGPEKAETMRYLQTNKITAHVPASMLHLHPCVTCIADPSIHWDGCETL